DVGGGTVSPCPAQAPDSSFRPALARRRASTAVASAREPSGSDSSWARTGGRVHQARGRAVTLCASGTRGRSAMNLGPRSQINLGYQVGDQNQLLAVGAFAAEA